MMNFNAPSANGLCALFDDYAAFQSKYLKPLLRRIEPRLGGIEPLLGKFEPHLGEIEPCYGIIKPVKRLNTKPNFGNVFLLPLN